MVWLMIVCESITYRLLRPLQCLTHYFPDSHTGCTQCHLLTTMFQPWLKRQRVYITINQKRWKTGQSGNSTTYIKNVFATRSIDTPPSRRRFTARVKDGLRTSGSTTFICLHRPRHELFVAGRFAYWTMRVIQRDTITRVTTLPTPIIVQSCIRNR